MKSILILLLAALLLSNGAWVYYVMDHSVTLQHQTEELTRQRRIQELLAMLVVDLQGAKSRDDVSAVLRQKYKNSIVKMNDDTIEVDDVVLRFEGDTLVRVSRL